MSIFSAVATVASSLIAAKGSKGGGGEAPKIDLGTSHPGIDQARLGRDPVYAEAARLANEEHRGRYGTGFVKDLSPADQVAQAVNRTYENLIREGWTPAMMQANVAQHHPFSSTPQSAQAAQTRAAPFSFGLDVPTPYIIGAAAILLVFGLLFKKG